MNYIAIVLFVFSILLLPGIVIGIIRKVKARCQNRLGAPLFQVYFDLIKLLRKSETISRDSSFAFRFVPAFNLSIVLLVACFLPWLSFKPVITCDIFLAIYLLATYRFFSIIASLDSGSAFSAFGASREATLSVLVEPAIIISLTSLCFMHRTTDLSSVFMFQSEGISAGAAWALAGIALFICSLIEMSRMPIDDPATHLELTMVHEAMILENSGPNLALVEFGNALRLVVLFGLSAQCLLHSLSTFVDLTSTALALLSILFLIALALVTALLETVMVRLQWRKAPEFIAYGLTMSMLCGMAALFAGGVSWF